MVLPIHINLAQASAGIMKWLPHPSTVFAFLYAFLWYYYFSPEILQDFDTNWHLAAGDLIRKMGHLPHSDPWSFTAGDIRWYNLSWLWDVAISMIAEKTGTKGLHLFMVVWYAAIIALLYTSLIHRVGISLSSAALVVMGVSFILLEFFSARPHAFSFMMVAIFHTMLQRGLEKRFPLLLLFPLGMVLWVNIHGGFLSGFVLVATYAAIALLQKNMKGAWCYIRVGILCAGVVVCTPYGIEIYDATTRTLDSVITPFINEWQPYNIATYISFTLYMLAFILLSNIREKHIPVADRVLAFFWFFSAMVSVRHFAMFALISAPYNAYQLEKSLLLRKFKPIVSPVYRYGILGGALAVMVIAVTCVPVEKYHFLPRVAKGYNVEGAVHFIHQHYPSLRFLNNYEIGGKLIYHARDTHRLFIDGRAGTAYPEKVLKDYLDIQHTEDAALRQKILDAYRIEGIITSVSHPLALSFTYIPYNATWKEVYRDEANVIFIRHCIAQKNCTHNPAR